MIDQISGDFLQWVRGFYHVANRGSVTQAAVVMGREQPTITHQIKRLEKELGVTLFDRSFGRMRLTAEGQVLLDKAISLFEIVKEIKSGFRPEEHQGRIAIAATHGVVDIFLPAYVAKFRSLHPKVDFDMLGGVYEAVYESVESAAADFGICYLDSVPDSISFHELFESGTVLLTAKGAGFWKGKSPTLKQVAEIPLILFSHTGSVEPFIARQFAQAKLQPNVVLTLNNPVSVKRYVAMGIGAALVSDLSISTEDQRVFDITPVARYFPKRRYGLLLRKRKYLAPHVRAFIRTIKPEIQFN